MTSTIDALRLRKLLGRDEWRAPKVFGSNGWALSRYDGDGHVIVTADVWDDGVEWVHASMTRRGRVPTYEDMCRLHRAAFPRGAWAYHVFAPLGSHVNLHPDALHLWGRADGAAALPNFGKEGSI